MVCLVTICSIENIIFLHCNMRDSSIWNISWHVWHNLLYLSCKSIILTNVYRSLFPFYVSGLVPFIPFINLGKMAHNICLGVHLDMIYQTSVINKVVGRCKICIQQKHWCSENNLWHVNIWKWFYASPQWKYWYKMIFHRKQGYKNHQSQFPLPVELLRNSYMQQISNHCRSNFVWYQVL